MSTPEQTASRPPVSQARLSGTLSDGRAVDYSLAADLAVIGRSKDCDLVLEDPGVSRRHAQVRRTPDGWIIDDLHSANGVLVNGNKVQSAALADNDSVGLGPVRLVFSSPRAPSSSPATPGDDDRTVFRRIVPAAKGTSTPASGGALQKWSSLDKKFRLLLMAAAVVLVLLVLVSLCGREQTPRTSQTARDVQEIQEQDVTDIPEPFAPVPVPPRSADPTDAVAAIPGPGDEPSAQAVALDLAAEHAEAAQLSFDAGRLPDAVREWRMALDLDPGNETYRFRLETAIEQLTSRAEEAYRRGVRHYQFLRYEEAVREWNQVLHLVPDPAHPLHQNARRNLDQVQAQQQR